MAGTVDSEAVFVFRALSMGVPQPAVDAILQAGLRSMNSFAFSAYWACRADKELWTLMGEQCRSGIQVSAGDQEVCGFRTGAT